MTPTEEIETAIATLTELRERATTGHWVLSQYGDVVQSFESAVRTGVHESERDGIVHASQIREADAELIVTLHRTIDAQLALLRNFTEVYGSHHTPNGYAQAILNLARAINGGANEGRSSDYGTTKGD